MKTHHMVILAVAVLVLGFVSAAYLYTGQPETDVTVKALGPDSPLERPYSVGMGPADAKVVMVEFFDPACGTCRVYAGHVKTLMATHPDKVRLVLRYAPFHNGSDTMALILEAARKQGKYWEALDIMYETQPQWASHHNPRPELIWQFLPLAGIDVDLIREDINDPELREIVNQDIADGKTLEVQQTPQFFVNGKRLTKFGYPQLKSLLDSEVAAQY